MLFFKYIYEIYICGIFYGVFIESAFKAAGVSASFFAAWWGRSQEEEAFFSPSPSMLTPYPPRHASTTIWRGVRGGGKRGGGLDLSQSAVCQAPVNICRSTLPPPFLDYSLASTLLLEPEKAKRQPPHVAAHL